jgi:muramoyltetrapeptide carboxypeptidase
MVLMLEEVDEYLYSLDRMLHKLAFSAWAQAAQAILIGSLSALQDNPEPFGYSLEGLVYEALGPLEVPLAWGLPIGHGPANQPLIVGAGVEVAVAGPAARLTLISG